jgi:hypothetical protein
MTVFGPAPPQAPSLGPPWGLAGIPGITIVPGFRAKKIRNIFEQAHFSKTGFQNAPRNHEDFGEGEKVRTRRCAEGQRESQEMRNNFPRVMIVTVTKPLVLSPAWR